MLGSRSMETNIQRGATSRLPDFFPLLHGCSFERDLCVRSYNFATLRLGTQLFRHFVRRGSQPPLSTLDPAREMTSLPSPLLLLLRPHPSGSNLPISPSSSNFVPHRRCSPSPLLGFRTQGMAQFGASSRARRQGSALFAARRATDVPDSRSLPPVR
jgi:hypothetical protein